MNPKTYNRFAKIFGVRQRGLGDLMRKDRADLDARMDPDASIDTGPPDTTVRHPADMVDGDELSGDDDVTVGGNGGSPSMRHVSSLADMLVEAGGGEFDRPAALRFLLHTYHGRKLTARTAQHKRAPSGKEEPMQKEELVQDRIKKLEGLNPVEICKGIVAKNHGYLISEHELVALVSKYAQEHGTSFAALMQRQDDTGLAIRKAVNVLKNEQWVSRTSTLGKAMTPADLRPRVSMETNVDNPKTAIQQITEIAERQRRGTETQEAAFARAYAENPKLAAQERLENRPVATW